MAKKEMIGLPADTGNFSAIAVFCSEKPEKLAWLLDRQFNTSFCRQPDLLEIPKGKQFSSHTVFYQPVESDESEIWLVCDTGSLTPLKPKPEFLLVIRETDPAGSLQDWGTRMKSLPEISMIFPVPPTMLSGLTWLSWLSDYTRNKPGDSDLSALIIPDDQNEI